MGVGDAQPDAVQATSPQATQELPPERLGLGLADVQADHLAAAGFVHAVGDHQRLVAHPARLADPLDVGSDRGAVPFSRTVRFPGPRRRTGRASCPASGSPQALSSGGLEPLTKWEYAEALACAAGTAMWLRGPGWAGLLFGDRLASLTRSLRVSNARFRAATGSAPRYTSARIAA